MKSIMRRTVALVLMACLLLSVFPAVSLNADAASNSNSVTYNFVSTNGNEYATSAGNTGYEGYEALTAGQSFGNWSWLTAHASADTCVTTENINGNINANKRFIAVKLSGLPGAGTYDLAFTCLTGVAVNVYIMPGDYVINHYNDVDDGVNIGKILDGTTTTLSATLTAEQIGTDGGVILVFRGAAYGGSGSRFHCSKLVMNRKSYSVNKTYDFFQATQASLVAGTSYPAGVESWTFVKAYTTTTIYSGGIYGNLGGTTTAGRFVAVRLHDIPGAGSYELTFTSVNHTNNKARMEVYILPGDTAASSLPANSDGASYITTNGTKATGIIEPYSTNATSTLTVNITDDMIKDNSVVLVFYGSGLHGTASSVQFRVNSLEMKATIAVPAPKVAQVGDAQYTSVSEAITAAGANGTVQLIASVEENVTVGNGVTLDLNGNTVTGNVIVTDGNLIDSATDDAAATALGGVVGTVNVPATNTYLPLKDGATWRFFKYDVALYDALEDTTDGDVKFLFDIDIVNAAGYTVIKNGGSELTVNAELSWTNSNGATTISFTGVISGDDSWANVELNEPDGKEAALYLSVTNIPAEVTEVMVKPVFSSIAGVSGDFGGTVTYQNAA